MVKYIDIEKTVEILKKINVLMKIQHRSYLSNELEHIISFMESNTKNKQISLPDNLDEAAEKYGYEYVILPDDYNDGGIDFYAEETGRAFKAGAKWMAERIEEEKKKHFKNTLSNMGVEDQN